MSNFINAMGKFLKGLEPYPNCPKCGHQDVALDDNGDYEFFFCTNTEVGCEWESEPGEYELKVYDHEKE
jgi:transcription elongation factor Elf1